MTRWQSTPAATGAELCVYAVLVVLVLAGTTGAATRHGPLAARVNRIGIARSTLNQTVDAYINAQGLAIGGMRQPVQFKKLRRHLLDILIAQELLWQEAQKAGLVVSTAEVDRALGALIASFPSRQDYALWLRQRRLTEETYAAELKRRLSVDRFIQVAIPKRLAISDAAVHAFYVANPERFVRPEQIRVRHIQMNRDPLADDATQEAVTQRMTDIQAQLKAGADFATLARMYSEGPTAAIGGELGFFSRGAMSPKFETAAFALEPGEISDIVHTRFADHIIQLQARRPQEVIAEQEAREDIRQYLRTNGSDAALEAYLQTLRAAAAVGIFELGP